MEPAELGAYVAEGVYIGSLMTAVNHQFMRENGIGAVINLSGTEYKTDIPVLNILMDDSIVIPEMVDSYIMKFSFGVDVIKRCREEGHNVLVHCHAGINRSAALIAFYLIERGWTYDKAVSALIEANKKRNVQLLTNESFKYLLRSHCASRKYFGSYLAGIADGAKWTAPK